VLPLTRRPPRPGRSGSRELDICRLTVVGEVTPEINVPAGLEPAKTSHRGAWMLFLGFSIMGLAYGGLHCLAWNALFSSDLERLFWRVSSLTIASTGVMIALVFIWFVLPSFSQGFLVVVFKWIEKLVKDVNRSFKIHPYVGIGYRCVFIPLGVIGAILLFVLPLLLDLAVCAFIIFYILARAYLVVECFINVAHLPGGAYQRPQWSQYVPQIA
jgi:hypothetical protein